MVRPPFTCHYRLILPPADLCDGFRALSSSFPAPVTVYVLPDSEGLEPVTRGPIVGFEALIAGVFGVDVKQQAAAVMQLDSGSFGDGAATMLFRAGFPFLPGFAPIEGARGVVNGILASRGPADVSEDYSGALRGFGTDRARGLRPPRKIGPDLRKLPVMMIVT